MLRIFCVVTIFLFLAVPVVDSAKVLPRFKGKSSVGRGAVSSGLGVSPRFRVDRRA
ncbi:hypothetical protein HYW87_04090, partial [Candidatus Roizmanbacteria bacterium]|nr:hypothetical protein [Candidatus Roizmanbacteria bacterium]